MNPAIIAASLLAFVIAMAVSEPAPGATPSTVPTDQYVDGKGAGFETLAGSHHNLVSLVNGLRTGSEITLLSRTPTPTPAGTPPTVTKTTFTPPTRPMGYGNITHSLDLAQRQLAAVGITNPTAAQLRAALNGGTVTTAQGDVKLQGVLQLRSQGMGWGKIAHTIGVPPSSHASAHAPSHSGITTAGGSSSAHGHSAARSGIVTAAGGSSAVATANGHGQGNAFGANGGGNGHAGGHAGK